jgi:protein-S-isoprenylcysteine O-methyltransferase Ste14
MKNSERFNAKNLWILLVSVGSLTCVVWGFSRFDVPISWTVGWTYLFLLGMAFLINFVYVLLRNPVLIQRRAGIKSGTKKWDQVWLAVLIVTFIAIVVVARSDLEGVAVEPDIPWLIGLILFILGWAIATWPMTVNPFFEKTVRIQTEHDHHVIDTGPYAYVRHPGYVGFNVILISTPLLLDSPVTAIPCGAMFVAFVVRTALEDRTLQAELPGYREYAERVRYRLIPGLW